MNAPSHVVVGPPRHGVVRFGLALDAALRDSGATTRLTRSVAAVPAGGVHVQFTDRLFGANAIDAAAAFAALARGARDRGGRVTVTLHDVPQPSDGRHFRVRAAGYAGVCSDADGVVVNSDHERALLGEIDVPTDRVRVVPLPIDQRAVAVPTAFPPPLSVGIFGYVYPGKGHREVLDALHGLPPAIWFLAIGEASAGHDDLVEELHDAARRGRRRVALTGHVPEHAVTTTLRAVTVPVAHHRHVSASGSLNSWLAAGRRPLAPATRYTREIAGRNPGALQLYPDDDAGLRDAIAAALAEPSTTWLSPGTRCTPTTAEAADAYAGLLRKWHR